MSEPVIRQQAASRCPSCGLVVHKIFAEKDVYTCGQCDKVFTVMSDVRTGRVAFFAPPVPPMPHPLFLPKGSVRAMAALSLAGTCWLMFLLGQQVPPALLSLLLTVIGFYFGFRTRTDSSRDRIFDAAVYSEQPLFLPAGFIRGLLLAGFGISALVLVARNKLAEPGVMDFFVILLSLILGRLAGRVLNKSMGRTLAIMAGHAKAIVVLAACVCVIFVSAEGVDSTQRRAILTASCAIVSFYFGSRS